MSTRPWVTSSLIFFVLTLATLFDFRITVTFGKSLSQVLGQNPTLTSLPLSQAPAPIVAATQSAAASPVSPTLPTDIPKPAKIDFAKELGIPSFDTNGSPKTTITDILQTPVAKSLNDSFIPKEGTKTPYGLTIGLANFEEMKKWRKDVQLSGSSNDRAEKLMNLVYHPCCGAMVNPKVCGCGHAYGLAGLIKKMVQEGKSDTEIFTESNLWLKYFFPRHYVIMALFQKKMGRDIGLVDYSQKYSSIDAEKPVINYLTYTWDGNLQ